MTNFMMIGDVFGEPGRRLLDQHIQQLRKEYDLDFIVVNGENAAHGRGIHSSIANHWLTDLAIDVITTGNHAFDVKGIESFYDQEPRLLRPLNLELPKAGHGYWKGSVNGVSFLVVNIMGQVHMPICSDPFRAIDLLLSEVSADVTIVDMHADATSESQAMGWHCDGRVTAVLGTHTHVPTLDLKILPSGTAYVTDIGMTGPYGGVIGMDRETSLQRFYTGKRASMAVAQDQLELHAVIVSCNGQQTQHVQRICRTL